MKIKETQNYYSTPSLAVAATLSIHFPVDHIDRSNPHTFNFVFERTQELDNLLETYWRRQLRIEPQSYFEQLRLLKIRLHENA